MFIDYRYMIQNTLWVGLSGDRTPVDARFSAPSLLYNGYRVSLGVKRPGRSVDPKPQFSAEVKERGVGLHGLF